MDTNEIKALLERYWNCETTVEEERLLKNWFAENNSKEDLSAYTSIFALQNELGKIAAPESLKQKIQMGNPVKGKIISSYFYPFLRIAATVLIVVSIGTGIRTQYKQEQFIEEIVSETYTNPEDAIQDTRAALDKISHTLSKGQLFLDSVVQDSIQENQNVDTE